MAAAPVLFSKRSLLIALAVCAALQVASLRGRRLTPAAAETPVAASGSFQPEGWYPGEPFAHATGVRAWGSWSGSDDNSGDIAIGPFPAPRLLHFGASGYPNNAGNSLQIELAGTTRRRKVDVAAIGERWRVIDVELPETWVGRPIRIVGSDRAKDLGGWFAISEPLRGGRSDGHQALLESAAAWAVNGLLLGVIFIAAARWLLARGTLPAHWIPLAAAAVVALCGYAAFWLYFLNALVGVIFSWSVIAVAAVAALRGGTRPPGAFDDGARRFDELKAPSLSRGRSPSTHEIRTVVQLMLAVGAFYLAVLHLFPTAHDFFTLSANRFREAMPGDNMLSHAVAERLFAGKPPKDPGDEWYSSDRPPLQAGWQLLTWAAGKALDLDRLTSSGTTALWFQLLWVAGAYGLLRTLAVRPARAAAWVAVCALAGFFAQNTVFTWPKLAAAAFGCGAVALYLFRERNPGLTERATLRWSALFAALAWLAHGGVAFSFLALVPWIAWRAGRGEWRAWLRPAVLVAALALPWLAYQKFYDPPGNQLLKLHLAGKQLVDANSTWSTIRESYARIGWREAWAHKAANFHGQVYGDWHFVAQTSFDHAAERRRQEFFHTGRALTWWPLLALPALVLMRRRWPAGSRDLAALGAWLALTIIAWCLLIFGRYNAGIHHGSYAMMIGLFVFFSVLLERAGRGWLAIVAGLQAITFGTTWAVRSLVLSGPASGLPFVVAGGVALAWFVVRGFVGAAGEVERLDLKPPAPDSRESVPEAAWGQAAPPSKTAQMLRAWWVNPRVTIWLLLALASLMFLRKPHALHTPQLWAEDGSIFLMQQDALGAAAFFTPYMGYLHALPRIIAWLAAHLLDPAWWPAFYNGTAFLIWLAAIARLFSARFDLPGKPWLALAFLFVPHSGEVLFNVTNLQWVTGVVLIQQAIIRAPVTRGERIGDAIILALIGLTGPFVIAFLPLFAWRWWRTRNLDHFVPLAIALACAAVQAWFVVRVGPKFPFQAEPFRFWPAFEVIARRVVAWPMLGFDVAFHLPRPALRAIGVLFLGGLFAWALRPHPRRTLRLQIMMAFGLILLAGVYRARPDTWAGDNPDFGDRYFYIPRVLLAWLLIWEFDAIPRLAAGVARIAALAMATVHLGNYSLPAPKDYHWAQHVEPIRRGVPANIPTLPENWTLEYRGRPGGEAAHSR